MLPGFINAFAKLNETRSCDGAHAGSVVVYVGPWRSFQTLSRPFLSDQSPEWTMKF